MCVCERVYACVGARVCVCAGAPESALAGEDVRAHAWSEGVGVRLCVRSRVT